jgi:hypothetical protein
VRVSADSSAQGLTRFGANEGASDVSLTPWRFALVIIERA